MSGGDSANKEGGLHQDQLTLQQEEAIRNEIAATQPMISPTENFDSLLTLYKDSESKGFIPGVHFLQGRFVSMRRVRGDGNCFYRAFLFGYLDNLLSAFLSDSDVHKALATKEKDRLVTILENSMAELISIGYSEFAIETFYDVRKYLSHAPGI